MKEEELCARARRSGKNKAVKWICPQITQIPTDSVITFSGHFNHSPFTLHCSLFTVHRSLFPVPCSLFPVSCFLFTLHHSPFTIHHSPFTLHCSLFPVSCFLFTVHCSLFTVHRSPFTVHRSPPRAPPLNSTLCILHSTLIYPLNRVNGILISRIRSLYSGCNHACVSIPSIGSMAFL